MGTYPELYRTSKWRRLRAFVLERQPVCQMCWNTRKLVTPSTVVDHIQRHHGDPALFWDVGNLQALCRPCHESQKRFIDNRGYSNAAGADGWPVDGAHPLYKGRL
jgi:5-methylcytosine-specific restriction endonuclease McrA